MSARFFAAPGALLVAAAAALWGTDALLRRPLAHSTQAATIVFAEHVVLVLLTLGPARERLLWRLGAGNSQPSEAVGGPAEPDPTPGGPPDAGD